MPEFVTTEAELEAIYGQPAGPAGIKEIELRSLRESIGYVSQEPVLILGTIRDNLIYGNVDATEEDINSALEEASATFVFDLEQKLDTSLEEIALL